MSLYTKARKHIDMDRVKELREEKIKRKKIADEIREQIREELTNLNSPEFSNWRWDLDEGMTTSDLMTTTLPATGDTINFTINSAESDSYNLTTADFTGSWVNLSGSTGATRQSFNYGTGNGAFPGTIDSALYFAVPFNGDHSGTGTFYYATTRSFEVKNNSITLSAIAGNSSTLGQGLGSNGGTLPHKNLDVYGITFNDDNTVDDVELLGTVPKTTSSLTNFTFEIPAKFSGKTISLNFYSPTQSGDNYQFSWLVGENVSFHPTALEKDEGTAEVFWSLLNYDELDANAYYKQLGSKTTLAYLIWAELQILYTGDSNWGQDGNNTLGYPAPVSGGRTGLTLGSSPMSQADLDSIVSTVESQFSSKKGMNTTTYALGNINFQRKTPMNVFVGLDDPEATAFIRTSPVMKGLSSGETKKKLEDMLDAGDEYLLKYLGITQFSARPTETTLVEPFQKDVVDWQGRWASQGSGVRTVRTTRTIETPTGSSTETPTGSSTVANNQSEPKNDTEKFADDNGLPRDYKDKLGKANAYFHNNLNGVGYRTLGFNSMDRMNALKKISYEKQGFTKDQIDTIEKKQLVKNTYGASPSYKEPEPEKKPVEKPQYNSNRYNSGSNTRTNTNTINRTGGSRSTSTSNSFSNIRVADNSNISTNTSTSSGVKDYGNIAAAGVPRNTGGSSSGDPNNIQWPRDKYPNKKAPAGPGARTANVPGTKDYGDVASARGPYGTPGADKPYVRKGYKDKDGKFVDYDNPSTWPSILKKASNKQKSVVAHYEPEGEVLSEKKRLKSVKDATSKIPGYYDGKPAPLGFPMQEPPKMKNGFHPDLVDGKKIANRFNNLDPQSAKAMPPTGNPYIDKKVRAAAKKPK